METNERLIDPFVISHTTDSIDDQVIKYVEELDKHPEPLQYPNSIEFDFRVNLEIIDLDKEAKESIAADRAFRITSSQSFKTNLKNPNGIFSTRYGQGLQDESPYATRYRCKCGKIIGKVNNRTICPYCKSVVQFRDDDFGFFGWVIFDDFCFIHPALYTFVRNFIGKNDFDNIIEHKEDLDQDGNVVIKDFKNQEESFKNIGMIEFHRRFDEIIEYYANKYRNKPNKMSIYNEMIMQHRDIIWQHSFGVYTSLLRPYKIDDGHFYFEGNDQEFNIIAREVAIVNDNKILTYQRQEQLLYHIQAKIMKVINNIDQMLSGKKGVINGLIGGKYNFMSRCVIIPEPTLKVDEISLPYACLMGMMKELIINNIQRINGCNYMDAYLRWYEASLKVDDMVVQILENLIRENKSSRGIPVLVNRNPTLHYGSIMQMYCVRINTDSYAMGLPLQVLKLFNADFDGDVMNCLWIINEDFYLKTKEVFNPREAMFISHNNGFVDENMFHSRETMMNWNSEHMLAMDHYTDEERIKLIAIKTHNRNRVVQQEERNG